MNNKPIHIYHTYKESLFFILKFSLLYILLSFLFNLYLQSYSSTTDPVTLFVGQSVTSIFNFFGIDAATLPLENEAGLKLIIQGKYIARIVEGCTAISVIIMFVAFVLSFGKNIKFSLFFALGGSLFIFIFNIFRIVFLGYILLHFPEYQDVSHRILFPVLIYGFVVLLWIFFVQKQLKNETLS